MRDGPALDSHVHSEWSWDAHEGSMERSCAEAVRIGLPAIAFTEHLDHTVWSVSPESQAQAGDPPPGITVDAEGRVLIPAFDFEGYLASVERCRDLFPELRVLSGLEVGEPHWHVDAVDAVLRSGTFDRVLGSLHALPDGDALYEPFDLHLRRPPSVVFGAYLAEITELVTGSDAFSVLAHIDYPLRYWGDAHRFDPHDFEDELRAALRATAQTGRALEINTVLPLDATILRWWHDEGGTAVTFGSDAHEPANVARGFAAAAAMAEACGFRPTSDLVDPWSRAFVG
ncbi:MAG: PHP domain-containing protein [Nocardioides sp.]